MINITINKTNGVIDEVTVTGHAGSAKYGEDLICCAVSTAFQSLVVGANNVLEIETQYVLEGGNSSIILTPECDLLARTFEELMLLLEIQYNKFMKVEVLNNENDH